MRSTVRANEPVPVFTFLTNFLIGGTERQVLNLVRHHDRRRFDVHLGCFRRAGALLQEVEDGTVALSEYPIRTLRSPRVLWQQLRLARYLRRHRVRLVHAFGFYASVFAIPAARLAGVGAVVASIRDTGDHLTPFQKRLQKWVCRAADHVLVNAQAVRDVLLAQGYDGGRLSVIPNGVDLARVERRAAAPGLRAELGLPESGPVVAVFSRLNPLKGVEYFLEAASMLAPSYPTARFLIVGDSISQAYRNELETRAAALGVSARVVFAGFRSDVPELLSEVAVSVLPSLSEGLSNVVLEGMAAGVPVVATSVGGTPEMIEDGVTGLLVPPRDAGGLAQAIASLLSDADRAQALGEAGRRQVLERFSLAASVHATEQLYERLMHAGRGRERVREAALHLARTGRSLQDEECP